MLAALIVALCLLSSPPPSPPPGETAAALYRDVSGLTAEGDLRRGRGDVKVFEEKYRLAAYLLEKIAQDFPDWNRQTVAAELSRLRSALASPPPLATPPPGSPVECFWREIAPGAKFEPEPGAAFAISLEGGRPSSLVLSYRNAEKYAGDARICVQLCNTPRPVVLQDTLRSGLFAGEGGKFPLALYVPSGSLLYLGEFTENISAPLRVLSNIVTLP
jgi:hypothetical protein